MRQRTTDFVLDRLVDLVALAIVVLLFRCAPAVYSDSGPLAVEAGDPTALMSGCGVQAAVGSLYCRFPAGWVPTGEIVLLVPPTDCPADSCASVTMWQNDLSRIVDRRVPKGQTRVVIPWSKILGDSPVQPRQRGIYPVLLRWAWTDPVSGEVLYAATEGEVRLRIHAADYTPLSFDPSRQTWTWRVGDRVFGATDSGRTAIEQR